MACGHRRSLPGEETRGPRPLVFRPRRLPREADSPRPPRPLGQESLHRQVGRMSWAPLPPGLGAQGP